MFRKYLLYAVGEVIILILGILIALQVNNWNEFRQQKIIEITILRTFKSDLEADIKEWGLDIGLHNEAMVSMKIIQDHIEMNLPYHDSLNYHFVTSTICSYFAPRLGAFETLKSTGVNIISNDSLRIDLIDLYTKWFAFKYYQTNRMNAWQTYGSESVWNTRFDQAENWDDDTTDKLWDGSMIPHDFEALKNDNEYKYFLKSFKNATVFYRDQLLVSTKKVSDLLNKIDDEILKLES